MGSQGAERHEEFVVDGSDVVQEGSDDTLDALDAGGVEWCTCVFFRGQLDLGAIDNFAALVWRMLGLCWCGVAIFQANFVDGAWHEEATRVLGIVPRDINSCKLCSCPISCDGVVRLQGSKEMVCMLLFTELDAKVINDADEHDRAPFVAPEAWSCGGLEVAVRAEVVGEKIVGKFAGLFEAVDGFGDLKVYPTIVGEGV